MIYYSTVTSKGQITLPASIRKSMNLKAGQKVSISEEANGQVSIKIPSSIDSIRSQFQANLKKQGFTQDKLSRIAREYKSGDGLTAYVEEKYSADR